QTRTDPPLNRRDMGQHLISRFSPNSTDFRGVDISIHAIIRILISLNLFQLPKYELPDETPAVSWDYLAKELCPGNFKRGWTSLATLSFSQDSHLITCELIAPPPRVRIDENGTWQY